jgi:hypothetical protein
MKKIILIVLTLLGANCFAKGNNPKPISLEEDEIIRVWNFEQSSSKIQFDVEIDNDDGTTYAHNGYATLGNSIITEPTSIGEKVYVGTNDRDKLAIGEYIGGNPSNGNDYINVKIATGIKIKYFERYGFCHYSIWGKAIIEYLKYDLGHSGEDLVCTNHKTVIYKRNSKGHFSEIFKFPQRGARVY